LHNEWQKHSKKKKPMVLFYIHIYNMYYIYIYVYKMTTQLKSHLKLQHQALLPQSPFHTTCLDYTFLHTFFNTMKTNAESQECTCSLRSAVDLHTKSNSKPRPGHPAPLLLTLSYPENSTGTKPQTPPDTYRYGPRRCGNKYFDNHFDCREEGSPQHTPVREHVARQILTVTRRSKCQVGAGGSPGLHFCPSPPI
jgi:hypothetical protein